MFMQEFLAKPGVSYSTLIRNTLEHVIVHWGDNSGHAECEANMQARRLIEMIDAQLEVRGYFRFEQPAGSLILLLLTDSIQKLLKYDGVRMIMFDMCNIGLRLPEDIATGNDIRVLKPTVIVTNVPGLELLARSAIRNIDVDNLLAVFNTKGIGPNAPLYSPYPLMLYVARLMLVWCLLFTCVGGVKCVWASRPSFSALPSSSESLRAKRVSVQYQSLISLEYHYMRVWITQRVGARTYTSTQQFDDEIVQYIQYLYLTTPKPEPVAEIP